MIDWNLVGAKAAIGLIAGTPGCAVATLILITIFVPQQGSFLANLVAGSVAGGVGGSIGEGLREIFRQNGFD